MSTKRVGSLSQLVVTEGGKVARRKSCWDMRLVFLLLGSLIYHILCCPVARLRCAPFWEVPYVLYAMFYYKYSLGRLFDVDLLFPYSYI